MATKNCNKCNLERDLVEFGRSSLTKDGLQHTCKICFRDYHIAHRDERLASMKIYHHANKEQNNANRMKRHRDNPDVARSWNLNKLYGISLERYNAMVVEQKGLCKICKKPESAIVKKTGQIKKLSVDHSHRTGAIRHLLCCHCNEGLGNFKEDVEAMASAINYLIPIGSDEHLMSIINQLGPF